MTRPRLHGSLEKRHNRSRWADLMTLALPALHHAIPGEAQRLASGQTPRWTLGGGTALALRLGHRVSDDIDVFISGIALAKLTPARNPFAKAIHPYPQWPGHYLKFERDEGEIDFLSSALQTSPGFTLETFKGATIALETSAEIIVKKIRYRAAQFTPRDAFDLACVTEDEPEVIAAVARETVDALPRLTAALDSIGRRGPHAIGTQVRPEPTHEHLMIDTIDRAKAAVSKAMALAAEPIAADAAAAMRDAIRSVSWLEPGSKRGRVRFGWDDISSDEQDHRLAAIDARPVESKELLLHRWRELDPKAFDRWDAGGRTPDAGGKPVVQRKTRKGVSEIG